jgi:hypothetical protein
MAVERADAAETQIKSIIEQAKVAEHSAPDNLARQTAELALIGLQLLAREIEAEIALVELRLVAREIDRLQFGSGTTKPTDLAAQLSDLRSEMAKMAKSIKKLSKRN